MLLHFHADDGSYLDYQKADRADPITNHPEGPQADPQSIVVLNAVTFSA